MDSSIFQTPFLAVARSFCSAAFVRESCAALAIGISDLLIVGLANDEIGYIVPPSDFLLNEKLPYIEKTMDHKGENHYEETNAVGPLCAQAIADAFERAVQQLNRPPIGIR